MKKKLCIKYVYIWKIYVQMGRTSVERERERDERVVLAILLRGLPQAAKRKMVGGLNGGVRDRRNAFLKDD